MDEQFREAYGRASGQIEKMIQSLNASAAFGEPVKEGDVTLIPLATVAYGFGSGQGWGRGPEEAGPEAGEPDAGPKVGEGGGGGGGGGGLSRPMGYIRIDPTGVVWEPLVDPMKMSLGGMFLVGWIVFWVLKTIRTFAKTC